METINLNCFNCKYKLSFGCAAFPEGIPDEILMTNEHDKPLPQQQNELVFEINENQNHDY